jgi:hypothetical protein
MAAAQRPGYDRDPWERAPTGELGDPLLPRWFVLLVLGLIPVAVAVLVVALLGGRPEEVPAAARRPPPAPPLTSEVGAIAVGETPAAAYEQACPLLRGVQIAGGPADVASLEAAVDALCRADLPVDVRERLERFASAGGVVRFAVFERSGVDVASDMTAAPPTVYLNARFTQTDPRWIGPLIVHETVVLEGDPDTAATALRARRAEQVACQRLLRDDPEPQGCRDAAALLDLPDPIAALEDVGYR